MKINFKKQGLIFIFVYLLIIIKPVFAYAGPGVAIGAIIVFITVILTFFASFFITIFKYIKKFFNYLRNSLKKKNKIGRKKDKTN